MNKKILTVIGILCLVASAAMFAIGSGSSHLTELKDFFWVPLPLGVLMLVIAMRKKAA
ncbi:MAG: hypothetical protein ABIX01_07825 [Chitinophagaceae bacterium]